MLNFIRNNSQSLGVKLAFGIIILVFVFWGLGSVQSMNSSTTVATVNGEAITVIDFEQAYQQTRESVRAQNPQITAEQIKQLQLPQQVLQQLIVNALLTEEIKRLKLSVSPEVLREAITSIPAFQNAEGKFDAEQYKRFVDTQYLGAGNFEAMVREELTQGKLRQDLTATAKGFSSETAAFFGYTYEERDIDYIFFPAADHMTSVAAPAADAVKAFYESNRALYALPAKVDVAYVSVTPEALGKKDAISAEAVQAYYDANKSQYEEPKKFKARHILLTVAEDATQEEVDKATQTLQDLATQIKEGADFATLATEHSQDPGSAPNGGDLQWLSSGDTVPAFNDVLITMQAGDMSDVVRTNFGVHLIKVDEVQDARLVPLAEVEDAIRTTLATEEGTAQMGAVVDALIEANVLGKDLDQAAKGYGLEVQKTGLSTADALQSALKITPAQATTIITTESNVPLDTALTTQDKGYVIARVGEKVEASVRPFEEVKEDIITALTKEAAVTKALETAAAARKTFDATAPDAASIKSISKVMRGQAVGELGNQPELGTALFGAEVDAWLPSAFAVTVDGQDGAVLTRVSRVGTGAEESWKPMEEILSQALVNQRQEKMFQLFLFALSEKAQVEIVNQEYLDALMAQ